MKNWEEERRPKVFLALQMKDASSKKVIVNQGGNDNSEADQKVASIAREVKECLRMKLHHQLTSKARILNLRNLLTISLLAKSLAQVNHKYHKNRILIRRRSLFQMFK